MDSLKISNNVFKRLLKEPSSLLYLLIFPILAAVLAMAMTRQPIIRIGFIEPGLSKEVIGIVENSDQYIGVKIEEENIEEALNDKTVNYVIAANTEENNNHNRIKIYSLKKDDGLAQLRSTLEGVIKGEVINAQVENPVNEGRMVLGFSTMFILMFMGAVTGNILEDRRMKTLMRIYTSPLGRINISLGYLMSFLTLGGLQVLTYILITRYIMKIEYHIPLIELFFIVGVFLITATGISIGLAGFVRDSQRYSVLNTFITVPTCLLGGSFFPVEFLPDSLKVLSNFIPQKWFMEVYDKLAEGASIVEHLSSLGILLMFGVVFFTLGIKTINPSLEEI
ncbi:ABC transporter permease [Alkaliphilus serpentinus]|uniref:ABC transporter permease n=1 Tax=Alkaliphilus serpentinus TaxID=1482731 RepID=A0A833MA61_9FIRM|nr:ABC transporter permease [Alkaliphilus serpentinus]KAB3531505.1 ABC transporter permease [Alkaliphilus serpentinus]